MSHKVPLVFGAVVGASHFTLVGIPFITYGGGGEGIGYLVLFVDFPLYVLSEFALQRLLLNSVAFNFFWFVGLGALMYSAVGYGIGLLFNRGARNTNKAA